MWQWFCDGLDVDDDVNGCRDNHDEDIGENDDTNDRDDLGDNDDDDDGRYDKYQPDDGVQSSFSFSIFSLNSIAMTNFK